MIKPFNGSYKKSIVASMFFKHATHPNCGKLLRALITTLFLKGNKGTRLIAEPNSNKIRDWTIRSQAPKFANDKNMEKVQRLNGCGFSLKRGLKI